MSLGVIGTAGSDILLLETTDELLDDCVLDVNDELLDPESV